MTDALRDLELLIRSRHGLIVVDTPEEDRAGTLLRLLADRLDLPLFTWTRARGLRRDGMDSAVYGTAEPLPALDHVEQSRIDAVYHFHGLGRYLSEPVVVERLGDAARHCADRSGAVLLTGADVDLPEPLRLLGATFRLPAPSTREYLDLLERVIRELSERGAVEVALEPADLDRLVAHLKGLTLIEAEKILTRAIVEDGRLAPDDIRHVVDAKREVVEREGLLEYYPVEEAVEIADLAGLRGWLAKRSAMIADPRRAREFGLSFPRGVLLVGVPGCGKSLCAKAVAAEWRLPLLRLDPSSLYNKYIGESERNFARAVRAAERLAPVVLWIDELEKAFAAAGGEGDGGVSTRILGSFLSWMQERKGDVFIVATANDVSRLPPEFVRKGRFDEIFFVDLPDAAVRRAIFEIHLRRRGQVPDRFDLPALAGATDAFSGAEIEQVVVSGLYTAFAAEAELTTAILLDEARRTRPLAHTMAERIAALRAWSRDRTVPAQ